MRMEQETGRGDHKGLSDPTLMKEMTKIRPSSRKDHPKETTYLHLRALHQIQEEETQDHQKTILCVTTVVIVVDQQIPE